MLLKVVPIHEFVAFVAAIFNFAYLTPPTCKFQLFGDSSCHFCKNLLKYHTILELPYFIFMFFDPISTNHLMFMATTVFWVGESEMC